MRINFITIILLLVATSCEEKTIINRDADYEPHLVVTGFIGNQNPALVYIQKTQHPLKPKDDEELIAEVLLNSGDHAPVVLESFEMNFYTSDEKVIGNNGQSYSLKVITKDFGIITSAQTLVPETIRIDSVKFVETKPEEGNFHIYFTDPPGKNFYSLKIMKFLRDGTLYDRYDSYYALMDPYSVFDDVSATNGSIHEIHTISLSEFMNDQRVWISQVKIILYHLDPNAFKYFRSLQDFDYTKGQIMNDPTIIHSNIQGGYGVFGAYATDTLTLTIRH